MQAAAIGGVSHDQKGEAVQISSRELEWRSRQPGVSEFIDCSESCACAALEKNLLSPNFQLRRFVAGTKRQHQSSKRDQGVTAATAEINVRARIRCSLREQLNLETTIHSPTRLLFPMKGLHRPPGGTDPTRACDKGSTC
jgi:hypothetical protein